MYQEGNNIEALKSFRVNIPLYSITNGSLENGVKYFFPDLPIFKNKNIVGIDANLFNFQAGYAVFGDLLDRSQVGDLINMEEARDIYLTIYDQDNTEKFYNLPLRSLFMVPTLIAGPFPYTVPTTGKKVVKPFYGKINSRKSYVFLPPGVFPVKSLKKYISLNFYYN